MQIPSGQCRQRLLAEAFEQGIQHFDVARMYGLGAAEGELGKFARGRRNELTIATKFGIEPAVTVGRLARLQAPARAVLARFPALRNAVKRRADVLHQLHRYDPATARASLEISLRELDTDYVDVFFVHGPASGEALDMMELGAALEDLRHAGLVRAWGFAGDPEPCIALSGEASAPTVLQFRDDILDPAPTQVDPSRQVITFGILSGALRPILDHVRSSARCRSSWTSAVGEDCGDPEVVASLLLQDALARNRSGTVLFSTTRPEHIAMATRSVDALSREPDQAPLRAFRELVLSELTAPMPVHA